MNHIPGKHILIIDDSLDQQVLLRTVLEADGYRIDCTSNGEEALTHLDQTDNLPTMILLDMYMPVMGGVAFRNLQIENPRMMNIPVIVMTGATDLISAQEKTNAAEILVKPFNVASLMDVVKRFSRLH